ncbi:MAG: Ig-like domain-containing protein, partial [Candidatus Margulisiibacteriota bacterium]
MKKRTSLFFVSILMVGIAVVLTLFGCASVVEETTTTTLSTAVTTTTTTTTTTTSTTLDTTPPSVTSVYPADGATTVALGTAVSTVFSKQMDSSTINTTNFKLGSTLGLVTGSVTYDAATRTATFSATSLLANAITYTATISAGVKDTAGNNMSSAYAWSFTTSSASNELFYQKDGAVADDYFGYSVS